MSETYDLLVIGDANPDVIVGPVSRPLTFGDRERLIPNGSLCLGGSAAIMAAGAARLGLRVAFAGRVGDDAAGAFVRAALTARGVDTRALVTDPDQPTPLTTILVEGNERAMLTAPGCLAATSPDDVPLSLIRAARHVHAASFYLMPLLAAGLAGLFAAARQGGATTSLDTNDDPADAWNRRVLDSVLAVTDVLLPNAAEVRALTGSPVIADAAGILARRGPLVVVKDGANGALAHDGSTVTTTPAVSLEPVDTVGAGDSFDAGFIGARLNGQDLPTALAIAAACGSLSTRGFGGTATQATWDEAAALPVGGNA